MTSPQQPASVKIWTILAALAPPALVGAGFWTTVRDHPLWSALALAGYFALLFGTRVLKRVVEPAVEEWIRRTTHAFYGLAWRYRTRYLERLEVSLKFVELLGAKTSTEFAVRLPDVYVDLSLKRRADDDSHADGIATDSRISLDSLIDAQDGGVFVITGGPGSGKTTLLRFKALQLAARRSARLPIVLELRHHVKSIVDAPGTTVATLTAALDWLHGSHSADWIERNLQRGRCLVMLDGLDEVADEGDRRKVMAWVRTQTDRYRRNPFVVTSRPHGYRVDRLSNADELEVRRFTSEQIHRFVRNWYRVTWMRRTNESGDGIIAHAEREADDLIERLRRTPALFKLAENPMLLTMITNVHITGKVLPGSRASLYGEICEMLLHKREEAKAIGRVGDALTVEQKLQVCRTLASHMMYNRVRDLTVEEAQQVVRDALASTSRRVAAEDFLAATEHSGLLVQPVEGEYAFAHLTFQEYLAAMALRETNGSATLASLADDPWWHETTLLWSAGANATDVVEACLESGSAQALRLALACADEARDIAPGTRTRLERMRRSVDGEEDRARRHAVIAARIGHALADLAWLGEETVFVARPVAAWMYGLHLRDLDLHPRGRPPEDPEEVRLNLWDVDVARFIAWINGLPGIGGRYRLPTSAETADYRASQGTPSVPANWVQDGPLPGLYGGDVVASAVAAREWRRAGEKTAVEWLTGVVKPIRAAVLRDAFTRTLADVETFLLARNPDHTTALAGLIDRLEFARTVAPSKSLDDEVRRMRAVHAQLGRAIVEAQHGEVGQGDVVASLQKDYERETDVKRKALLDRQIRTAQDDSRRLSGSSQARANAERKVKNAIGELRPLLVKSRDRLDTWLADKYPGLADPARLDAAVATMIDKRHAQAAAMPGGILPVLRVVLLGAWDEARRKNPARPWVVPAGMESVLLHHSALRLRGTPFPGPVLAGLDTVVRLLRGTEKRRGFPPPDLSGWREGIVTMVEHARARLAPILAAEVPVDPDILADARFALAVAALTAATEGEPRRILQEAVIRLAIAEHRALASEPPPEMLLLVRA